MPGDSFIEKNISMYQSRGKQPGDVADYDLAEEKERIYLGKEEIKNQLIKNWKRDYAGAKVFPDAVLTMPADVVDFLLNFQLVAKYDEIASKAGLDTAGRNKVPGVVWQIAQSKHWDDLENLFQEKIPCSLQSRDMAIQMIQQDIIAKIKNIAEKPVAQKISTSVETEASREKSMTLGQAMIDYPNVGEQNVTNNQLKLRYFPTPVRPSIKNWITDYHDNLGAVKHGAIDRGNYLFHSENGKRLTPMERQKLSIVLKSLDEGLPVNIDTAKQMIVFQGYTETPRIDDKPAVVEAPVIVERPEGGVRFSSAQKLPVESQALEQGKTQQENPPRINKNIVDLKSEN